MALGHKRAHPILSRLHFLIRLIGLAGLLAVLTGVVLLWVEGRLPASWDTARHEIEALTRGEFPRETLARIGVWALLGGAAGLALFLVVESLVILRMTAGRRSVSGFNTVLQVAGAVVLLVGINVFAFRHPERIDCTRPDAQGAGKFTLPGGAVKDLQRLRGKTTVVLLQQRRERPATGKEDAREADANREAYENAAEAVVVAKVRDLAEQLRSLGLAQLEVIHLDARKKEFPAELENLKQAGTAENRPARERLVEAIRKAPGSSIFFYAEDGGQAHIQRVSFDNFYQLDLKASLEGTEEGSEGRPNLVLLTKGVEPLLRRIRTLQERKPRVGLLLTHEAFATESGADAFGHSQLRKTLERHGFEVRDILLKRDFFMDPRTRALRWEPAAATLEENHFEALRTHRDRLPLALSAVEKDIKELEKIRESWEKATDRDLKQWAERLGSMDRARALRTRQIEGANLRIEDARDRAGELKAELKETEKKLSSMDADVLGALRRMTDLHAKLDRLLAGCDLLMVPRPTMYPNGEMISVHRELHQLEDFQLTALKEFLRQGKPVLFCLGPTGRVLPRMQPGMPPVPPTEDSLEKLLGTLGVKLDGTTVLYQSQAADYYEQRNQFLVRLGKAPSLDFRTPHEALALPARGPKGEPLPALPTARQDNPLRRSLRIEAEASGGDLGLSLRFPRPVSFDATGRGSKPRQEAPEFLWTRTGAWKDEDPLTALDNWTPASRTSSDRFPLGVAFEATLPADWYPNPGLKGTTRLAVIGKGSVFVDDSMNPARERLLLDTCNWLLGRDDLLATNARRWVVYERLSLDPREKKLWQVGAWLGVPILFAALGLVVLLARRVR
jgi:hypothetical protein